MEKKIFDHSIDADEETLTQFKNCYSQDFVVAAALMPDAHKGYVAPIGAVLITKDFIVPAWVGYDVGCGLIALRIKGRGILEIARKNAEKIYKKVLEKVPMGVGEYNKVKNISSQTVEKFHNLLEKFKKGEHDKNILRYLESKALKHLGTLGGGNHFIELDSCGSELWLVIHSGSRGIGHEIAKKYMIKASSRKKGFEETFPIKADSKLGKEYLNILDFCLEYALLNRMEIAKKVLESVEEVVGKKVSTQFWANKNHNHVVKEDGFFVHRKGATPAKKGEKGIIPGNMRDGTYLVIGKGNPEFLFSSSHGAGRILSRKEAKRKISIEQFRESMKGIHANISIKIIDEAPMAYKNIDAIMEAQKESVKVVKKLAPFINWKG